MRGPLKALTVVENGLRDPEARRDQEFLEAADAEGPNGTDRLIQALHEYQDQGAFS